MKYGFIAAVLSCIFVTDFSWANAPTCTNYDPESLCVNHKPGDICSEISGCKCQQEDESANSCTKLVCGCPAELANAVGDPCQSLAEGLICDLNGKKGLCQKGAAGDLVCVQARANGCQTMANAPSFIGLLAFLGFVIRFIRQRRYR